MRLDNFCDTFGLEVAIPNFVAGCPGGPFSEQCTMAPVSRIPIGLQAMVSYPSLIDYCLSQPGMLTSLTLSWDDAPADHAWLFAVFSARSCSPRPTRKTVWKCRDMAAFSNWLSENSPGDFQSAAEFHAFLSSAQNKFADVRSCRERSRHREPLAIKETRDQLRRTNEEHSRQQLQALLKQQRKLFFESLAQQRDLDRVRRGGALYKAKKLHKISKMTLTAATGNLVGVSSDDTAKQEREVLHEYSSKWGARDFIGGRRLVTCCRVMRATPLTLSRMLYTALPEELNVLARLTIMVFAHLAFLFLLLLSLMWCVPS